MNQPTTQERREIDNRSRYMCFLEFLKPTCSFKSNIDTTYLTVDYFLPNLSLELVVL